MFSHPIQDKVRFTITKLGNEISFWLYLSINYNIKAYNLTTLGFKTLLFDFIQICDFFSSLRRRKRKIEKEKCFFAKSPERLKPKKRRFWAICLSIKLAGKSGKRDPWQPEKQKLFVLLCFLYSLHKY